MYDAEVRAEIGEQDVRTSDEALAIIFALISKQSNGEAGDFENTGANIQYVQLKNGEVIAVSANWRPVVREWFLNAYRLDGDGRWVEDSRVFVCSLPVQAD